MLYPSSNWRAIIRVYFRVCFNLHNGDEAVKISTKMITICLTWFAFGMTVWVFFDFILKIIEAIK